MDMRDTLELDQFVYLCDADWLVTEQRRLLHKFRAAVRVVAICNVFMRPLVAHVRKKDNVAYVLLPRGGTPWHTVTRLHCIVFVRVCTGCVPWWLFMDLRLVACDGGGGERPCFSFFVFFVVVFFFQFFLLLVC